MGSFSAFDLSTKMVSALDKMGYKEPSPVQTAVIPKALRGENLIAQSETGSGKTHAYLVPIIDRIDIHLSRLQAIVICPTRELARQTFDFAKAFERYFPTLKVRLFTSEANKTENTEGLTVAPQLVIGTPGRLKDLLISSEELNLRNIKTVVLDEADMLLDLGYFDDIAAIFGKIEEPQVMVFSATLKENLKPELRRFIGSEFEFESEKTETASGVSHHLVDIKHVGVVEALKGFLKARRPYLVIVFASKKDTVNDIFSELKIENYNVTLFSGDLEKRERRKAIRMIRENRYQIIIASDILSRGIDIPDVTDVVSIDLPNDLEFYYHRAGRTGRFGKKGDSWVFYNSDTTQKPMELIALGTAFDYYALKGDILEKDPIGLTPKSSRHKKKRFSEDELRDVKIAKANAHRNHIEPNYKKKAKIAVDRVKTKYRKKAIQKAIRREKNKRYADIAGLRK